MTFEATDRMLKIIREAYRSFVIEPADKASNNPGTIEIWYQLLRCYSEEDCLEAIDRIRKADYKRQFAPGLFEVEGEVRNIVQERNDALRRSQDVKRVVHNQGDNPETSERYFRTTTGEGGKPIVREYVRASKSFRREYLERLAAKGVSTETVYLKNGAKGLKFVRGEIAAAASAKDVGALVDALKNKMSMPEPQPEDYSERYEWGSIWETMDSTSSLPMQDNTPIGPADFVRKREVV